ncbi:hypothetical protein [Paenibacillus daejeonensis]|uniref:hypothetical protein n=1 Tax=Paenibacillus daejeonensis TaxID=135193 RepID=UPI00036ADD0D|nr:hypothetical protein [Paenibacillus daejeonensis]
MPTGIVTAAGRRVTLGLLLMAMLVIGACSGNNGQNGDGDGSPPPPDKPGNLVSGGFYARGSADLLGTRNCRGMCWDYYYFFNDQQVIKDPPPLEGAPVNCSETKCLDYEVKDEELIIDGKSYSLDSADSGMILDGNLYVRHEPMNEPELEGVYHHSTSIQDTLGSNFASTSTLIFRPDGTFLDNRFLGVLTDGSEFGDGTGIDSSHLSEAEAAGTYRVEGYTIYLAFEDGSTETFLFFRPDLNDRMYKIGGRDFVVSDLSELVESAEEQQEEEEPSLTGPLPDKLVTEGYAEKTILAEELPDRTKERGAAEIQLHAYQWAELAIDEAYQEAFTGFGEGPIIALTVQYTIANTAAPELDLTSMIIGVDLENGHVAETAELAPTPAGLLAQGNAEERLAVFLFPAEMVKRGEDFTLVFSELLHEDGLDAMDGGQLIFDLRAPD